MPETSAAARKLKGLRERARLSSRQMADALGMGHTSYQHYEDRFKRRYLPPELVEAIVPILAGRGVESQDVRALGGPNAAFEAGFAIGRGRKPQRSDKAPVLGYVGAGERVFMFGDDDAGFHPTDAPPGLVDPIAFVVRGDSMDPVYRDGDIIIADRRQIDTARLVNHDCIVQVADGPLLCKRLRKGSKRGHYHLLSYNRPEVIADQVITEAAPIRWVRRA